MKVQNISYALKQNKTEQKEKEKNMPIVLELPRLSVTVVVHVNKSTYLRKFLI